MALTGWERFQKEAGARQMKPLLGTEIVLPEKGSLLLFPLSQAGYFSLVPASTGAPCRPCARCWRFFCPAGPTPCFCAGCRKS